MGASTRPWWKKAVKTDSGSRIGFGNAGQSPPKQVLHSQLKAPNIILNPAVHNHTQKAHTRGPCDRLLMVQVDL